MFWAMMEFIAGGGSKSKPGFFSSAQVAAIRTSRREPVEARHSVTNRAFGA
jgi:hypothetical protein